MVLTRFVRIQLAIFTVASMIGITVMALVYVKVPMLLGVGRMTVTVELPQSGGLYKFANVTYRGVQVGKVSSIALEAGPPTRTAVTVSLDRAARIPGNLTAEVHSISAIGEQYIDLVPHTDTGPFLHAGSVIAMAHTTVPQPIGPVLDRTSTLLSSIPKGKLNALLDETFAGLQGADFNLSSLSDSSARFIGDLNHVADRTRTLVDDSAPLLDGQAATAKALRSWTHSLAGVSTQLADNDPQIRAVLRNGPGAADEVSRLLTQIKPTLPILLANLTTIGQIGVTYNPSLQQVLVLLPPFVSTIQAAMPRNNATGVPTGGEFGITAGDPNPCTVGFLPPSSWRSPADTSDIDTPNGLYCKLPQDSPSTVRGARNYPCMEHPGKRAPTVELCDDPRGFQPLADRQHITGPNPLDPNLLSQGVPPDSRAGLGDRLFGPLAGTPPPDTPPGPPAPPTLPQPPIPIDQPDPAPGTAAKAAPSGFAAGGGEPSVAVAQYNPRTGNYVGADAHVYNQSNLAAPSPVTSWTDLLPH